MNSPQEFDQHKETYRSDIDKAVSFSGQSHDFFTRVKAEYLIELLQTLGSGRGTPSPDARPLDVLDIGCGHGHIHPYLVQSAVRMKLSGIEVAATVLEEARLMNPTVDYRSYEGERLTYAVARFDAA